MRDYVLVAFVVASLHIGLLMPFYGLTVYTWLSFMYPNMLTWSFGLRFPSAKLTALATFAGVVLTRSGDTAPLRTRETAMMLFLWITFTVSTLFAINSEWAWDKWQEVSKLIIMALVSATLLTTRKRLRVFLLVIGLSIGFYGLKGGLFSMGTSGEQRVWGPGTSIIGANNAIGLALNMCLPILWYLAAEERGYLKKVLYVVF